jgi:hypothetical protein
LLTKTLAACGAALVIASLTAVPAFAVSGGQPATNPATAPWMATIARTGSEPLPQRELCGGVLIAPDRIATASHCLDHGDPTLLELHIGGGTLSTDPGWTVPIKGFATNPGFRLVPSPDNPQNLDDAAAADDAAIIVLAHPVWGVPVLPVAKHSPAPGTPVTAFGHGLPAIDALQEGKLSVLDHASCDQQMAGTVDAASVLCAQHPGTTICAGDSGGPLVGEGPELVGLTSFSGEVTGKQCGQDTPAGFADAAKLRAFLVQPHPVLAPMPTADPTITGTKTAGSTVTCQAPKWTGHAPDSTTHTWDENKVDPTSGFEFYVPIDGAPQTSTLAVTKDLASHKLLCVLDASTKGGTVELLTNPN